MSGLEQADGAASKDLPGSKEKPNRPACHEKSNQIRKQSCRNCIPGFPDPRSPEINADGVERGFRRAQHHSCRPANEGIRAVFRHQFRAHSQGGAAADGPDQHQHGRLRRDPKDPEKRGKESADHFHGPGGPEHMHCGHQHYQGRNQGFQQFQPFRGSLQKQIVGIFLPAQGQDCADQENDRYNIVTHVFQTLPNAQAAQTPSPAEHKLVTQTGTKISKGAEAPKAVRTAATLAGIS